MKALPLLTLCVGLLAPAVARADAALFKLDAATSTLAYKVVHKFHTVEGTSKQVEGAAVIKPGVTQVQIRAAVASFDSGNANRDAHMKETVEAAAYPEVSLKGVINGMAVPSALPNSVKATLDGQLTFHGVTQAVQVPATLAFSDASHVEVTTAFDVSLDAYKIERPSLMFIKINDACHITVDLHFAR